MNWELSGDYTDILYATSGPTPGPEAGIAKITINRPEVRNAFRPRTIVEMSHAFDRARDDPSIGVIILTGAGTMAFCSGGDQRGRGDDGYVGEAGDCRMNGTHPQ